MIVTQNNFPHVTHLPLLYDAENRKIRGHIAKGNPIAKLDLAQPHHCMAIFHGPDCYVSPTLYPSKAETGKVVPTWNYAIVHVSGELSIIPDRDWVLNMVSTLSDVHEASISSQWKVTDAPEAYIDVLLKAIVGIEISVESIKGKFKLSQNKPGADWDGISHGLHELAKQKGSQPADEEAVALWMEKIINSKS